MRSIILLLALAGLATAQDARELVNQGVAVFKNAQYAEAVQLFQKAVDANPNFVTARLYLATAYMQQYIPGAESAENRAFAECALREFNKVLELDAVNRVATASIASLYLSQARWDQAQQWYEKFAAMDPSNAGAFHSLGFIAWSRWYPAYMDARKQSGMKPEDDGPLPDQVIRVNLRGEYLPTLQQGIQSLEKALAIDPQHDDAMAYMNLLIRGRAVLMDTQDDFQRESRIADEWVQKALKVKEWKKLPGWKPGASVVEARLTTRVEPVYPSEASKAHIIGTVDLEFTIDISGHPKDIRVMGGDPALIPAAVDALTKWVYDPLLVGGKATEVQHVRALINFPLARN